MSNYWDVYCKDCKEKCGIENANHGEPLMRDLIHHRAAIAAMAPVLNDIDMMTLTVSGIYNISPAWFAKHAGHELVPIDEYGRIKEQRCENPRCRATGEVKQVWVEQHSMGHCRDAVVALVKSVLSPEGTL